MKRRNYKGRELLPLAVSDAARAGGNSLPFPCSSRLRALSCVLERGNIFAEKSG